MNPSVVVALCLLTGYSSVVQAQWREVVSPTSATLYGICFASSNVGICVGDSSTILRTSDAGDSWIPVIPPIEGTFSSVYFSSPTEGWIAGSALLHTTDAGLSWDSAGPPCGRVHFSNPSVGHIAVGNGIKRTTDGGKTWRDAPIEGLRKQTPIKDIDFPSADTGYAVSAWSVLRTVDSGKSWVVASSGFANNDTLASLLEACHFFSGTEGVIGGWYSGLLLRTTNAAKDWEYSDASNAQLYALSFPTSAIGYAAGWKGRILKTTDAGITWRDQLIDTGRTTIYSIAFYNELHGFAIGARGKMFRTRNGGTSTVVSTERQTVIPLFDIASHSYSIEIPGEPEQCILYDCLGKDITMLAKITYHADCCRIARGALSPGVYLVIVGDRGTSSAATPIVF